VNEQAASPLVPARAERMPRPRDARPTLSVRHLKIALTVAETRSITGAADALRRSQPAVTKAINAAEKALGVTLFERTSSGVAPTEFGEMVVRRARQIAQTMKSAEAEYVSAHANPRDVAHIPLFTMSMSIRKLRQIISLYEEENVEAAASAAGVSPSAIYRTLHELEAQLELPLFARLSDGRCIAVGYGVTLAQHLKLLFSEIRHCVDDISSLQGREVGRLSVGVAASMQTLMVPMAVVRLREEHPNFHVSTHVGLVQDLVSDLKTGDIDVIVGGFGGIGHVAWVEAERLFDDRICIVARADHPLARKRRLSEKDFANVKWVHPPCGSPADKIFERFTADLGIVNVDNFIETSATVFQRGLLLCSDYLTLMTYQQARLERELGILTILPYTINDSVRPVGLVFRRGADLSPSARSFIRIMRDLAREFGALDDHDGAVLTRFRDELLKGRP
jgi:LysR family transcriptional regulator of gallate degradation